MERRIDLGKLVNRYSQFLKNYKLIEDYKLNAHQIYVIVILETILGSLNNKRILDVGCGSENSFYKIYYKNPSLVNYLGQIAKADVMGIDIQNTELVYDPSRFKRLNANDIDKEFGENQFDAVVSTNFFGYPVSEYNFIRTLEIYSAELLEKMSFVTKKGGVNVHFFEGGGNGFSNINERKLNSMGFNVIQYFNERAQIPLNELLVLEKK